MRRNRRPNFNYFKQFITIFDDLLQKIKNLFSLYSLLKLKYKKSNFLHLTIHFFSMILIISVVTLKSLGTTTFTCFVVNVD